MKNNYIRMFSIILCLILMVGLLPISAFAAEEKPVNNFTLSDDAVKMIQSFEGFAKYPVWDYAQYSVGYGSRCPDADYNRYMANGISYAEADALFRQHIKSHERAVNNFANNNELQLTQNKFDALVSFSYNVGSGWMSHPEYGITQAVLNDVSDNEFIFTITQWCNAGGKILTGLVNRRLAEANLYLNGEYSKTPPKNYKYILYTHTTAIKDNEIITIKIQAYDAATGAELVSDGYKEGYRFLGWYTENNGNVCVDMLDDSLESGQKLYPKWQDGEGNIVSNSIISGTSANYMRIVTTDTAIYKNPTIWSSKIGQANENQKVNIISEYVNKAGIKWGRIANGGWIDMQYTKTDLVLFSLTKDLVNNATETTSNKTQKTIVGILVGADINVYEILVINGQTWGNTDLGWLCLDYIDCVLFQ